ncbi:hypothetical protein [Promicromonospora panici]|uniref:hypothetical protein n=1 Tax=Promicromonospora panici TaxID=2219658 RepID=UPI00101D4AAD|nr:hypothetical protein [Promicromonospora panici]
MAREASVPRPVKKNEYTIVFASKQAQKGWLDVAATKRRVGLLTRTPHASSPTCHQLKFELATVERAGRMHDRWQCELPGGARIWFYVTKVEPTAGVVHILDVHTHHPNETK